MKNNEELLQQAILFAKELDYISVSGLQRKFLIGYQQANKLLECLIETKICAVDFTPHYGHLVYK
ncbi:DNA translocase FtsK [Acinetobacter corruptisaponis]|uniref:DNA translocase FtsK n=1 Tax=Acinetobacter corruptisaponis TaxID=3045147 RepID=A0ABY8S4Y4_9GAMM|nr:DNA translocase FtsK [Acinetobacter sp. KCTC 92772]WHP06506.1 DNA translocase FtsK [Acinetobacter sp. KCTC 92772]